MIREPTAAADTAAGLCPRVQGEVVEWISAT
jgi:hypothetical protein